MATLTSRTSRLDVALMLTPFDVISTLVSFGCEQAFTWMGQRPHDDSEFYFELGRRINQLTAHAWEVELQRREPQEEHD